MELRYNTPVNVEATAGLRLLGGDRSDRILQAMRDFLKNKSFLKSKSDWVTILDGNQKGAYQWPRAGITEVHFLPFNPVDKRTAITYYDANGEWHRCSKGAPEQEASKRNNNWLPPPWAMLALVV